MFCGLMRQAARGSDSPSGKDVVFSPSEGNRAPALRPRNGSERFMRFNKTMTLFSVDRHAFPHYNRSVMKETLIDLKTRRSCRKYTSERIKPEELDAILEAGTYAPTGHGTQSPIMVVVQDPAAVSKLSAINARIMNAKHDPFYGAGTLVIVFADTQAHTGLQDAALVMGNLMNAAHAIGIGSCWINRAKEMFESEELQELRLKWNLPAQYEGMGICALGYAAPGGVTTPPKPRKVGYIVRD